MKHRQTETNQLRKRIRKLEEDNKNLVEAVLKLDDKIKQREMKENEVRIKVQEQQDQDNIDTEALLHEERISEVEDRLQKLEDNILSELRGISAEPSPQDHKEQEKETANEEHADKNYINDDGEVYNPIKEEYMHPKGYTNSLRQFGFDARDFLKNEQGKYVAEEYGIEKDTYSKFKKSLQKRQNTPPMTEIIAKKLYNMNEEELNEVFDDFTQTEDSSEDSEIHYKEGTLNYKMVQALRDSDKALSVKELASKMYGKDISEIENSSREMNGAYSTKTNLLNDGVIEEVENSRSDLRNNVKLYQLTEQKQEQEEQANEDDGEEESLQPDIPSFTEEETLDAEKYGLQRRKIEVVKALEEYSMPLTINEIGRLVFKLPEGYRMSAGNPYYNRVNTAIDRLKQDDVVRKSGKRDTGLRSCYELIEDREKLTMDDSSRSEEDGENSEKEVKQSEVMELENLKDEAGISDRDMEVLKLTFDKLVNRKNKEQINYHDFEQHYTGDRPPLKMFQKMFGNPALLNHVADKVLDGKKLKWNKQQSSKYQTGVKNWVINVQ